jgi:hypothetical protein
VSRLGYVEEREVEMLTDGNESEVENGPDDVELPSKAFYTGRRDFDN